MIPARIDQPCPFDGWHRKRCSITCTPSKPTSSHLESCCGNWRRWVSSTRRLQRENVHLTVCLLFIKGITPYPTLSGREVLRGVPNGVRPEIPSSCRQELSETMTHCWHKDPSQRPSFTEVRKSLSRALVQWQEEVTTNHSEYIDVSGFSEDYENGMIYFNRRVSEFECEI